MALEGKKEEEKNGQKREREKLYPTFNMRTEARSNTAHMDLVTHGYTYVSTNT